MHRQCCCARGKYGTEVCCERFPGLCGSQVVSQGLPRQAGAGAPAKGRGRKGMGSWSIVPFRMDGFALWGQSVNLVWTGSPGVGLLADSITDRPVTVL